MDNLTLTLAHVSDLVVRRFVVREALSSLFTIDIEATSTAGDLDLDLLVGHKAAFEIAAPWPEVAPRVWGGMVSRAALIGAEPSGATRYEIQIAPELFCALSRRNNRIFQHRSAPDIVKALLAGWEIVPELRLDLPSFPAFEYRVQYEESDWAFVSRTLEDAAITYFFEDPDPASGSSPSSKLVLSGDPTKGILRAARLPHHNTKDLPADSQAIGDVRIVREVRPGRATVRDFDFRGRPDHALYMQAEAAQALDAERRLEVYRYAPGAFVIESEAGKARVDEKHARAEAERVLASARHGVKRVTFRTNVMDLAPGIVFGIDGHPHPDLGPTQTLLATSLRIEGERGGEWSVTGEAALTADRYAPRRETPRPKIWGVQSALVVGPVGDEIHTDELGRVKVQFHWDRDGERDDRASCFLRVSQAAAGGGHGFSALPRVGEEVLVSFFEGDPDAPIVVGRVHNAALGPPMGLPANKTQSAWRSRSSPGGEGHNEIRFEDKAGEEELFVRAERDMLRVVGHDDRVEVRNDRTTLVGANEHHQVDGDQDILVAGDRQVKIEGADKVSVTGGISLDVGGIGGFVKEGKIVLTTGQASLVLDGPNLYLDAKSMFRLSAGDTMLLTGGHVEIDGSPSVAINGGPSGPPLVSQLSGAFVNLLSQGPLPADQAAKLYSVVGGLLSDPGAAPGEVSLPPEVEAQLAAWREKVLSGMEGIMDSISGPIEDLIDAVGKKAHNLVPDVEAARAEALAKLEQARQWLEATKAKIAAEIEKLKAMGQGIADKLGEVYAKAKEKFDTIVAKLKAAAAEIQALRDKAREAFNAIKDKIFEIKDQIMAEFDALRQKAIDFYNQLKQNVDEIKGAIQSVVTQFKGIISDVKQTVTEIANEIKSAVNEVKSAIQEVKQTVKDIVGVVNDIKNLPKTLANEVKQAIDEVKETVSETVQEVKDTIDEVKSLFSKEGWQSGFADMPDGDDIAMFSKASPGGVPEIPAGAGAGGQGIDFVPLPKQGGAPQIQLGLMAQGGQSAGQGFLHLPGGAGAAAGQGAQGLAAGAGHHVTSMGASGGLATSNAARAAASGGAGQWTGLLQQASDAAGAAGNAASGGPPLPSFALPGVPPSGNPLEGATVLTQSKAFAPQALSDVISGSQKPVLLQSPSEGQWLVAPTQAAKPFTQGELTQVFVDAQMSGLAPNDAMAAALMSRGYVVYERPWDSWLVALLKKVIL